MRINASSSICASSSFDSWPIAPPPSIAAAQLLEVGLRVAAALRPVAAVDAGAEDREVDLEHGVEHPVVPVVLHERGAERGLERLAVFERHELDRAHRVEVLGHRHREPGEPELVHEALQDVEHGRLGHGRHARRVRITRARRRIA